jgi:hypothetical protein
MKTKTLVSIDRIMDAVKAKGERGFCTICGAAVSARPDARKHKCPACRTPNAVYGADELLLMSGGFLSTIKIKGRFFINHLSKNGSVVTTPTDQWGPTALR